MPKGEIVGLVLTTTLKLETNEPCGMHRLEQLTWSRKLLQKELFAVNLVNFKDECEPDFSLRNT